MKHVLLRSKKVVESSSPRDRSQTVGTGCRRRLLLVLGVSSASMIPGDVFMVQGIAGIKDGSYQLTIRDSSASGTSRVLTVTAKAKT